MKPHLLTSEDLVALAYAPPDYELAYGLGEHQFGHLYLPTAAGPHPVVVLVHGGCWQAQYSLHHLSQLCRALAGEQTAVWSLEYRRLGGGGGWPTTFQDVSAGTDFLRQLAQPYNLDLSRVVAAGHSAGGHLVLWLGSRHRLPADSDLYTPQPLLLRGVVSIAGVADLATAVAWQICDDAPQTLVGGMPQERPQHYQQASPAEMLPLGLPQRLVNGQYDHIVPPNYVAGYETAVRAHQEDIQSITIADAGHFELVVPTTHAWPILRDTILALLQGKLSPDLA